MHRYEADTDKITIIKVAWPLREPKQPNKSYFEKWIEAHNYLLKMLKQDEAKAKALVHSLTRKVDLLSAMKADYDKRIKYS